MQFGFGKAVTSRSDNPTLPTSVVAQYPTDSFHLKYQIGPGLRFFFIPQFALTLLSGIEGDHFFATQDAPSGLRAELLGSKVYIDLLMQVSDRLGAWIVEAQGDGLAASFPFLDAVCHTEGEAVIGPLIRALRGEGDTSCAILTATALCQQLRARVQLLTKDALNRQTPQLWPLPQHGAGEYLFQPGPDEIDLPSAPPLAPERNPYRGLLSFEERHSHLFFGRERWVERLEKAVHERPLCIVLGASGSGKSSLVQAGLLPRLRGNGWTLRGPLRPGRAPLHALEKAVIDCFRWRHRLGVDVAVGERLGVDVTLAPGMVLRAYRVALVAGTALAFGQQHEQVHVGLREQLAAPEARHRRLREAVLGRLHQHRRRGLDRQLAHLQQQAELLRRGEDFLPVAPEQEDDLVAFDGAEPLTPYQTLEQEVRALVPAPVAELLPLVAPLRGLCDDDLALGHFNGNMDMLMQEEPPHPTAVPTAARGIVNALTRFAPLAVAAMAPAVAVLCHGEAGVRGFHLLTLLVAADYPGVVGLLEGWAMRPKPEPLEGFLRQIAERGDAARAEERRRNPPPPERPRPEQQYRSAYGRQHFADEWVEPEPLVYPLRR